MTQTCALHPAGSPVRPADTYTLDQCRRCWVLAGGKVVPSVGGTLKPSKPARGRCLHLGVRTEFRPGCSGRLCLHTCEAGEPHAVPGGVCQTCPKWEAE